MIYVSIWFDVEDYFSPESDDADKHAAELASDAGVPVTVKIVGEKARALERNGRHDVIRALARHAVGYHSDWHSRPPTIASYLADLGWERGVAEFERREWQGLQDLVRILGRRPICFGQPGSSWAPQIYPALRKWDIQLYLDEAPHIGLPSEQPFWFQGMLNVFNLRRNAIKMEFGTETDLRRSCDLFQAAYSRLEEAGGGLISLYYHPQEFIYRCFQDVLNFGGGANLPADHWRTEGRRTPAETLMSYRHYQEMLRFMQAFEGVCFVDAGQIISLYAEPPLPHDWPTQLVLEVAKKIQGEVSFVRAGDIDLSAAEAFDVLNRWLMSRLDLPAERSRQAGRIIQGPTEEVLTKQVDSSVSWPQFQAAALETACFLDRDRQIPSVIRLGDQFAQPEDFVVNLGKVVECLIGGSSPPAQWNWQRGKFTAGQYASKDSPELWAWPIFPNGFQAPNLMRLARLQMWTIKPARIHPERDTSSEDRGVRSALVGNSVA